jgi:hypothetical protein
LWAGLDIKPRISKGENMKKSISASYAYLGLTLALGGCLGTGDEPIQVKRAPPTSATTASVRLTLPRIDLRTLPKSGADTSNPLAWFVLSISGDGMDSIKLSFPFGLSDSMTHLEIKSVPVGHDRHFHGELLNASKRLTHVGDVSTTIYGDSLNAISLKLRYANGIVGLCVEIEGQPTPACGSNDSIHTDTMVIIDDSIWRDSVAVDSNRVDSGWVDSSWVDSSFNNTTVDSLSKNTVPEILSRPSEMKCWSIKFALKNKVGNKTIAKDPCLADSGLLKMPMSNGNINQGTLQFYQNQSYRLQGQSDTTNFNLDAIAEKVNSSESDTLSFRGLWTSSTHEAATGTTTQLPSGRKGQGRTDRISCADFVLPVANSACMNK